MLGTTTPSLATSMSDFPSPSLGFEDVSALVKRKRISQSIYRSTEREAKEKKS